MYDMIRAPGRPFLSQELLSPSYIDQQARGHGFTDTGRSWNSLYSLSATGGTMSAESVRSRGTPSSRSPEEPYKRRDCYFHLASRSHVTCDGKTRRSSRRLLRVSEMTICGAQRRSAPMYMREAAEHGAKLKTSVPKWLLAANIKHIFPCMPSCVASDV
ncbi:hypothetical protein B0H34DRAFT_139774 [Crassisporium funariophilum]|nr:hypothetical protein B0H34DRAFT_139774 [Crassisporium funariophilum]